MFVKSSIVLIIAFVAIHSHPVVDFGDEAYNPHYLQGFVDKNSQDIRPKRLIVYTPEAFDEEGDLVARHRRSLQPGAPDVTKQNQDGWRVNPSINRDNKGNTNTNLEVHHTGPDHEINAGWGKVVDGPGKAKPTWHADATFRW